MLGLRPPPGPEGSESLLLLWRLPGQLPLRGADSLLEVLGVAPGVLCPLPARIGRTLASSLRSLALSTLALSLGNELLPEDPRGVFCGVFCGTTCAPPALARSPFAKMSPIASMPLLRIS